MFSSERTFLIDESDIIFNINRNQAWHVRYRKHLIIGVIVIVVLGVAGALMGVFIPPALQHTSNFNATTLLPTYSTPTTNSTTQNDTTLPYSTAQHPTSKPTVNTPAGTLPTATSSNTTTNATTTTTGGTAGVTTLPSTAPIITTKSTESSAPTSPSTQAATTPNTNTLSTSGPPRTQSPTTQHVTTKVPTTQSPTTTKVPITQSLPTTQHITTKMPTTQSPTTLHVTTKLPTTQSPATQHITTKLPTTQSPTTQHVTTNKPTTSTPSSTPSSFLPQLINPVLPNNIKPIKYKLTLQFHPERDLVTGTVEIIVNITQPTDLIIVHAKNITMASPATVAPFALPHTDVPVPVIDKTGYYEPNDYFYIKLKDKLIMDKYIVYFVFGSTIHRSSTTPQGIFTQSYMSSNGMKRCL